MKVRIKTCSNPNYWYANQVGKEIEVKEPYSGSWGYEVTGGHESEIGSSVFRHDVEILQ